MAEPRTTSERIDSLPLLLYWLKQMQVDVIIDRFVKAPHANWQGLSCGEVALVYVAYVVTACTHFLSPMEAWARKHLQSLGQALGKPVRAEDFSDDRLAIVLSRLGDEQTQPGEPFQGRLERLPDRPWGHHLQHERVEQRARLSQEAVRHD